ncbi:hypothetical protein DOTSEDRAFT_169603 [Dothistroma septosporum NZE10]|uniref:Cell surface protein n=1 Tax=Dothistroma septosporum (strain NZE10 / CBS 128990) TaxID=675120 RepID=N1PX43_DOTSN|nr:hypothetical protein DOTSEDRAFT_169603 [Dothistroma septosporum NZE10]
MRRLSRAFRNRAKSKSDGQDEDTSSDQQSNGIWHTRKNSIKTPQSTIIVPLYIYPSKQSTWQPLYDAIDKHPDLNFLIIVNPNSGPGKPPWWPNKDYIRELPLLNSRPNVTAIGYVSIDYCRRDIHEVLYDIQGYSEWPKDTMEAGVYVEGIFFDETPEKYSADHEMYLQRLSDWARNSEGIQGDRLVVHNPGTMPDDALSSSRPDVVCVFEDRYDRLNSGAETLLEKFDRRELCYMVHSVPKDEAWRTAKMLRSRAKYVFLTEAEERFYEDFGGSWREFVEAMAIA